MINKKRNQKKFLKKKWSATKIINIILVAIVFFSIIHTVIAVTPNPGHSWAETGDGTFQIIGPTALRTYTFPDADATILTDESDPVFTAWDKSTGISITESQISDLQTYLTSYTETDPIFTAWDKSTGISITKSQVSDFGGPYLAAETDSLSLHLDQTTPQTFTNLGTGTGLMKVTAGLLGLDSTTYLSTESDPIFTAWDKSTGISITESQISDLQTYLTSYTETDPVFLAQKGAVDGVATLGSDGKIPSAQLPLITISNTFVVASEVTMLALTAETGDVAVRTDSSTSYILAGTNPTLLTDWQQLLTPTDTVLSVNGATGAVTLTTSDIAQGTNLYYTDAQVIAAPLTGYTSGAGTVAGTDTVLQAIQKLNGNTDALALGASSIVTVGALSSGSLATGFTPVGATLGGTGQSLYAVGDLLYADTTTSLSKLSVGANPDGYVLKLASGVPTWGASAGGGTWGSITGTLADQTDLSNTRTGGFGITLDGQGGVVSTGSKGYITIPYNGTITNWSVTNDVSGSIQFDIKRSGTTIIGAGNKPLTSGAISGTAVVASWTSTAVTAGDIIEFVCDSASTVTRSTLVVYVTKT
ncbi:MAG: hypothetical protein WC264_03935 [Candidatus Paceibacterota bacterium]|jgi:hypothetical protein